MFIHFPRSSVEFCTRFTARLLHQSRGKIARPSTHVVGNTRGSCFLAANYYYFFFSPPGIAGSNLVKRQRRLMLHILHDVERSRLNVKLKELKKPEDVAQMMYILRHSRFLLNNP
ncbi:hypothetical protein PUN28_008429 [Cardiocondyla obscurior]|uniref:Ribosomal protein S15 n=1 Tax=Cardiocondyla obscurior TaxID=286306 RepID=A0AAW2G3S4_9HYME